MRRLLFVALTLLASGCGPFGAANDASNIAHPYPAGCADFDLSARRCQAILDWAVVKSGTAGRAIASVDLFGDPGCGPSYTNIQCTRTMSFVVRMRVHFGDGGSFEDSVFCGVGGQYSILCTETPEIALGGPTMDGSGYRDVPCANETGEGCGIPWPSADPAALAAARPLRVPVLDIAIDHEGPYDIEVGHAVVPNGVIASSRVRLGNPMTQAVTVSDDGILFEVRPADPTAPPFDNYYSRGWHPGPEEVVVSLRFRVTAFSPGAVIQIRDVVVE